MRQAFLGDQHCHQQNNKCNFSGDKMNFGGDEDQHMRNLQQQRRDREMALALMNQNGRGGGGPQAPAPGQASSSSGLPTSIFDLYTSQSGRQDASSSFLSSSLLQAGGGGLENQNQLMFSEALNRSGSMGLGGGSGPGNLGSGGGGGVGTGGFGANQLPSSMNNNSSGSNNSGLISGLDPATSRMPLSQILKLEAQDNLTQGMIQRTGSVMPNNNANNHGGPLGPGGRLGPGPGSIGGSGQGMLGGSSGMGPGSNDLGGTGAGGIGSGANALGAGSGLGSGPNGLGGGGSGALGGGGLGGGGSNVLGGGPGGLDMGVGGFGGGGLLGGGPGGNGLGTNPGGFSSGAGALGSAGNGLGAGPGGPGGLPGGLSGGLGPTAGGGLVPGSTGLGGGGGNLSGGLGRASGGAPNPYGLNLSDHSALGISGGLSDHSSLGLSGSLADHSSLGLSGGLGDHSSLGLPGGLTGLSRGLPSPADPTGSSINTSNLDPLSAAFLRDNALMRERLLGRGGDLQLPSQGNPSAYGSLLGGGGGGLGSRDWTTRSLQQQLLAGSQLPNSATNPLLGNFMGGPMSQQGNMGDPSDTGKFPTCLPVVLAVPEDNQKLSSHQVLLRNQIEAFKATEDDLTTHTRGRNKPIKLGQVGIRCKHCARLPVARRQKGSTYFPASLHGLYQAAQNMNTTHMQSGLCTEMPPEYKQMFSEAMTNKVSSSVAGRPYWAKTAKQLGLIDTEDGIRFIRDLTPAQIAQIKASQQQQQQQGRGNKGIPARLLA